MGQKTDIPRAKKEAICIGMQDNDPCHTAKGMKNFLSTEKVLVLACPGNSSDLKPNKNVWQCLKPLLYLHNNPSVNL